MGRQHLSTSLHSKQPKTRMLYHIPVNGAAQLAPVFNPEAIAIIRSTKLAFNAGQNATGINFETEDGDILLHMSIRPNADVVVFNSRVKGGNWGPEERITLAGRFKNANPTITVYNHGDRFQILFDYATVKYYNKRIDKTAALIAYNADEATGLAFSDILTADVYASFAEVV